MTDKPIIEVTYTCQRCGIEHQLPKGPETLFTDQCQCCDNGKRKTLLEIKDKTQPIESNPTNLTCFTSQGRFVCSWLAHEILQEQPIATHAESKAMYYYKNGVYHPGGENIARQQIKKRLGQHYKTYYANETIDALRIETYTPPEKFDNPENCIALENGLLNTQTLQMEDFTPEYIHITKIPVTYNPEATCPQIQKFLHEILNECDIPLIQEMFGYCLYKQYPIHRAFMLLGSGANGKSTLINLLVQFIGKPNCVSPSLQSLLYNRFASAQLFGKLVNACADISAKKLVNTGEFKKLCGRDMLDGEIKHKDHFQFYNHAKLIYSANQLPYTDDHTDAFFRRWIIIDFPNQFLDSDPDTDPEILDKITSPDEMSGLLNWALEGLQRVLQQGHFSMTKSRGDIQKKWIMQTDSLRSFVDKCCEFSHDYHIEKSYFYELYQRYCEFHDIECLIEGEVTKQLPSMKPIVRKYRPKAEKGEKRKMYWKNIQIKQELIQEYYDCCGIKDEDRDDNANFVVELLAGIENRKENIDNKMQSKLGNSPTSHIMSQMSQMTKTYTRTRGSIDLKDDSTRDIYDTKKRGENSFVKSKQSEIICGLLKAHPEPYKWHIDEIIRNIDPPGEEEIQKLIDHLKELSLTEDSPIRATNDSFTEYIYREKEAT